MSVFKYAEREKGIFTQLAPLKKKVSGKRHIKK